MVTKKTTAKKPPAATPAKADPDAATNKKTLKLCGVIGETEGQVISKAALTPAINAANVVESYQANILGNGTDFMALVDGLENSTDKVKGGDLSNLEAMLSGQAAALESIFTSLAKRAANQTQLVQYQAFFGMAMKAQAQSRATISALVDLKYPRQATFVKQANIAQGHQQVNNYASASGPAAMPSGAEEFQTLPNKLLEVSHGQRLDIGAQSQAGRVNPHLDAVEAVHRAEVA